MAWTVCTPLLRLVPFEESESIQISGIDVDYEDTTSFNGGTGDGETWLINFTTQLRTLLPQGTYILTHAPLAPWFSPSIWGGGGYLKVHESVGSLIDWYNVQFYNRVFLCLSFHDSFLADAESILIEGTSEYTTVRVDPDRVCIGSCRANLSSLFSATVF